MRSASLNARSNASESRREASRQSRSRSACIARALSEPVQLEAGAQRDARAVQDHPAVVRGDALRAADGVGLLAQHLALEEHAPARAGYAPQASLEHFPEAPLLEGRLG